MTDGEFLAYLLGSLFLVYWAAFTWGKYARIIKDLGRGV